MTLATFKVVMAIGVLINSALYLVGCFVLGIYLRRPLVYDLAIAASGVTYLSFTVHFVSDQAGDTKQAVAVLLVYLSIVLGAGAGVGILFG